MSQEKRKECGCTVETRKGPKVQVCDKRAEIRGTISYGWKEAGAKVQRRAGGPARSTRRRRARERCERADRIVGSPRQDEGDTEEMVERKQCSRMQKACAAGRGSASIPRADRGSAADCRLLGHKAICRQGTRSCRAAWPTPGALSRAASIMWNMRQRLCATLTARAERTPWNYALISTRTWCATAYSAQQQAALREHADLWPHQAASAGAVHSGAFLASPTTTVAPFRVERATTRGRARAPLQRRSEAFWAAPGRR
jgi:hypothetical protein